ncbi:DUF4965 domain-containing protein [Telmatobacter sp. DSM 110680]|uniref:DUF4965 domain-containing protein n=1 Tax=Telmatobacter sp. DSM 110680 TaxID=3036704 RepID=A0AAU7DNJ3_9BACT
MKHSLVKAAAAVVLALCCSALVAQTNGAAPLRAPATPLIVHDPYFSVWSTSDQLTGGPTRHWTGTAQEFNGIVRVDGQNFRYLGNADGSGPALEETDRKLTPTRTIITLQNNKIELRICFLTPAFPDDMKVMSRPVTYLTWDVKSRDGAEHDVTLYLDVDGSIATNNAGEAVAWSRAKIPGLHLLRVGTQRQPMLEQWGDNVRINWGYFYLGVPDADSASLAAGNENDRDRFNDSGKLPESDDLDQPRVPQSRYPSPPLLDVALPLGKVGSSGVTRHVLLAYDDVYSIEYMHQKLLPYWRTEFPTFTAMLEAADRDYMTLAKRAEQYDAELEHDLVQAGGKEYAAIAILAFRQAIAAHKLVEDADGIPFFMPKENFSNGSISTVDVIYPSAPMFLFLNPKLVEAQLEPVARYAETPHWKFPFAPHDLGVYPLANGQLYGGGEISEDDQMPVEESGNMILLFAAVAHAEHDTSFAKRHWPLLTKWADYLLEKGFDPENQLCTDDFAGHLAHNTNLSIKAIEALATYAQLAKQLGEAKTAEKYDAAAKSMAAKWVQMAADGDHYRLAFDKTGTWSQKYNLVWDTLLGVHMFPADVAAKEIAFYKTKSNPYGLPLDNRAKYTKLDWSIWSATMATNPADFQAIVHPIFQFLNQTPDRIPMTDWYDTVTAHHVGFQARSVVGGVYIKMLADPELWNKWAERGLRTH